MFTSAIRSTAIRSEARWSEQPRCDAPPAMVVSAWQSGLLIHSGPGCLTRHTACGFERLQDKNHSRSDMLLTLRCLLARQINRMVRPGLTGGLRFRRLVWLRRCRGGRGLGRKRTDWPSLKAYKRHFTVSGSQWLRDAAKNVPVLL